MEEHDRIAESLEQDADRIQRPSGELKEDIKEVQDDWEQKTKTESVPGAIELPDEDDEEQPNRFEYEERAADAPPAAEDEDDSEESGS